MRTIKFRGKLKSNGKWEYGDLLHDNFDGHYIYPIEVGGLYKSNEVIPETMGQFTELHDSNGNEIYEGDILRLGNSSSGVCEVKWNTTMAAFCIQFFFERELGTRTAGEWLIYEKKVEVIGNIYDNPELMKIE